MRRRAQFGLTFLIMLVLSFSFLGPELHARASEALQRGGVVLIPLTAPPTKICVGQTLNAGVQVKSSGEEAFDVLMQTNIGSPEAKSVHIKEGERFRVVGVVGLKAENPGNRFISFMTPLASPKLWSVEVIDCEYTLSFDASYKEESSEVSFRVTAYGDGRFSGLENLSGSGTYGVTIRSIYNEDVPDVDCEMVGYLMGLSTFKVTGRKSGETVNISLNFEQLTFEKSPKFECEDENDMQAALAIFENLTVDPNTDFMMTALEFPEAGGSREFGFGNSTGTGKITITPRSAGE